MNEFNQFFEQLKEYLELQRKSILVTTSEGLSRVLSVVIIVFILLMLGSIMLLLLAFATAHWIGEMTGNTSAGFFILFAFVTVILAIVWVKRKRWINSPMEQLTNDVMGVTGIDRDKIKEDAKKSQQELNDSFNAAIAPLPKAKNRIEQFSQLISRGTMIFEGLMFGMKMARGFRNVFKK